MVQVKCKDCGEYMPTTAAFCPGCGKRSNPDRRKEEDQGPEFEIDCHACKLKDGMRKASLPRFSGFIRLIGTIITIPSILGMVVAGIMFVQGAFGGFGGWVMSLGASLFVFGLAAVSGLVGWLLLMKKNVFQCVRCGYLLDRS